ncbi:MAG TPA: restriction endonuclease subunit S [Mesotoga sp.]|nr:restriction endonuclease subunit S [Mesotoga sp.]
MSEEQLRLGDFRSVGEEHSSDEIPVGYKKTEIGIIPEDWKVTSLDSIARVTSGKRLPPGRSLTDKITPYPYIRVSDLKRGSVSLNSIKYVPFDLFPSIRRYRIFEEDLFISVAGTLGLVGKIPPLLHGANLTENADRITDITCSKEYLMYYLMSPLVQNVIDSLKTVGAQPKLALTRIRKFVISLPSTVLEQRAIAEVLTDVDNLIESLDNLISKKQAIKKATMQRLLTGRTRLPGFKEEWNHTKLGEVLKVCHGRNQRGIAKVDGRYPILASGGEIGRTDHSLHDGPSVLIGRKGTIDQPQFISSPFWTVDTLFYTSLSSCAFAKFIYYKFCLIPWKIYNEASGVPSLNAHTIEQIEIMIPSIEEQQAISSILLDMDAEIEALERQRDKMKQIKQGMMQQLLTGRIRLLDKEAV